MKKYLVQIVLLIPLIGISQVKIDSLGLHINNSSYIINSKGNSASNIYTKTLSFFENLDSKVLEKKDNIFLKIQVTDNYISYLRRTGKDGHIGHKSVFEIEFKDNKCRVKNIKPEFYVIFAHISDKNKTVKDKKKRPLVIYGKGLSLYDRDMLLRKPGRLAKPKIESYFNTILTDLNNFLNPTEKW